MNDDSMLQNDLDRLYLWLFSGLSNRVSTIEYFVDINSNEFFRLEKVTPNRYEIYKGYTYRTFDNAKAIKSKIKLLGTESIIQIKPLTIEEIDSLKLHFIRSLEGEKLLQEELLKELSLKESEKIDFEFPLKEKSILAFVSWDTIKHQYLIRRVSDILERYSIKEKFKILN